MGRARASTHVYSTSLDVILDMCRPLCNKAVHGFLKTSAVGAAQQAAQDIPIKESVTKQDTLCRKLKPTGSGFHKALSKSDAFLLSAGEPRNSRFIVRPRHVFASQINLLWRSPWTKARGYASVNKSRKQELRVSDEDEEEVNDEDQLKNYEVLDEQRISDDDDDDYEVLDEQRISDGNDDDYEDEEEEEDEEGTQVQVPAKKKWETQAPKAKVVDEGPILNEKITARNVRLVADDGTGHRVVSRDEALYLAKKKQMDLVQVDARANPPVCKIFNFQREQYKREQIQKERKKQKGAAAKLNEVKELRFGAKTEKKDLKMKVEKAKQFLEKGYKVKFVANFKGACEEEEDRRQQGKMLDVIFPMIEDVATIEQGPRVESRLAWVMLRHVKFGKIKKKPPKPAARSDATAEEENGKFEGVAQQG